MNYGHLELRIEELLQEKGISKNMICKELDIPRSNFNRYCRNEFQRLDVQITLKQNASSATAERLFHF